MRACHLQRLSRHERRHEPEGRLPGGMHEGAAQRAGEGPRVHDLGSGFVCWPSPATDVHQGHLPAAKHRLRPCGRWLRGSTRLWPVCAPTRLWRRRDAWPVRCAAWRKLSAKDVPSSEYQLRSGGRRLRQFDPVRALHCAPDVRGWRRSRAVRLSGCRQLRPADVRATEPNMRTHRRRLWQPAAMRQLHAPRHVWWRRGPWPMRFDRRRDVRADDVFGAEHRMRARWRWLRELAGLRQLFGESDVRHRRDSGQVRKSEVARVLPPHAPVSDVGLAQVVACRVCHDDFGPRALRD